MTGQIPGSVFVKILASVEPGGVLGSTGNRSGCRQRVEVHPLVLRVGQTQLPTLTTLWPRKTGHVVPEVSPVGLGSALFDRLDRRAARTR
jgi:hypothetical protein